MGTAPSFREQTSPCNPPEIVVSYGKRSGKGGTKAVSIHESGEMYLEAILVLTRRNGHVRSIDVSEYLGYSKPSVSRAMGILRNGEYICVDKAGSITLTESCLRIA